MVCAHAHCLPTACPRLPLVAHANKNNIGGAVVSLDQEKEFDPVEWSYLDRVIERMNFGPSFCRWATLSYNNISAILINGETSNFCPVTRGVRQGCTLSLLYTLYISRRIDRVRHPFEPVNRRIPTIRSA